MESVHFDLVYNGQVIEGVDPADVMPKLTAMLKLSPQKADVLFTGKAVVIKRKVDKVTADKYVAAFHKVGAVLIAKKVASQNEPAEAKAPPSDSPQAVRPTATPRSTLPSSIDTPSQATTPNEEIVGGMQYELKTSGESARWSVADPGADVLKPDERTIVDPLDVDTSSISVAEPGADVLRPEERVEVEPVIVDVSRMTMAETGTNLLKSHEMKEFVKLEVDLSQFSVAEAGADVLKPEERAPDVPPPKVDLSKFDVDEPGAILVTEVKTPLPPAPDVSHITLDEPSSADTPPNAAPIGEAVTTIPETNNTTTHAPKPIAPKPIAPKPIAPKARKSKASFVIDDSEDSADSEDSENSADSAEIPRKPSQRKASFMIDNSDDSPEPDESTPV